MADKTLIIVESPTKIKTLKKFLPENFVFESSVGHIRDLPPKKFGIDTENDFDPQYEILEGKKEVIDRLKKAAKNVDIVYLSPDPDREGEAIAWHISEILPKGVPYKRVTFNEFTKKAVLSALKHPREIDQHLVDAQQTRRLLDRIVGYKISPILQRKIQRGGRDGSLSAGRVQSVALKLVVDREKEIEAFIPVEYWNLGAILLPETSKKNIKASLYSVDGKRVEKEKVKGKEVFLIGNKETADQIVSKLQSASYLIEKVDKKEKKRHPVPPFITSTLQQEAARHHGFSASRTMSVAQSLYEGLDLGSEGAEGLITYMRTDSVRASPEAIDYARGFVELNYGKEYIPPKPNSYSTKKDSQDAHEAIRPTNLEHTPESLEKYLNTDQMKLYKLIWRRFLASQMTPAIYDTVTCDISTNKGLVLRATGSTIKFRGFLAVYEEKKDSEEEDKIVDDENILPPLEEKTALSLVKPTSTQSFTKPPPRYTEASLVKALEKSGIGRPSTYASIMNKIHSRAYTIKEKNTLVPTELGRIIAQMLEDNFKKIMDISFTAEMEGVLDKIAETDVDWKQFIKEFWEEFIPTVDLAAKEAHVPKIETDLICPKCGNKLLKIWAKNKYFHGCSNYPDCDYTAPLEELTYNKEDYAPDFDWEQPCPLCNSEMKVRKSRFGIFLGCTKYPECKGIVNIPRAGEIAPENMPNCPAIGCDGKMTSRRSRFGKTFFSCTNYPDCDVIVNNLDDLSTKYPNHPKTPYQKKTKAAKTTKTKAKAPAKKKTKKTATEKKPRKETFYSASKELQDLFDGKKELSRKEVTQGLWAYIKKNNLQDPNNKRLIVPDDKLSKLFGGNEPIDMMKLAGIISKHLKRP